MNGPTTPVVPRVPTGVPGLDDVLEGGLYRGGVYMVMGRPGAGKTILGNQIAFAHARAGGRVVYATLLSESHGRLLAFMREMSFFDEKAVGAAVQYLNAYAEAERDGLAGLLQLVRGAVRDRQASLVVIDGMMTVNAVATSDLEYKKFIQQIQTWIEVVGCTVVLLTSAAQTELRPEHTMVDGIVELDTAQIGTRRVRELSVSKLRGSGFREGRHVYGISSDGIVVYPRFEATFGRTPLAREDEGHASLGIPELDAMLGAGFARSSTTLLLGSSGAGKTMLGLHFLAAGLDAGERALLFGFYEDPAAVTATGDRLGLRLGERLRSGELTVEWRPSAEVSLDPVGHELLQAVARTRARRVFIDGVEALRTAFRPERLAGFFAALTQELRARGATTVITAEARQLLVRDVDVPISGISAVVENILVMRHLEIGSEVVRALTIVKTRDRPHGRRLARFTIGAGGIEMAGEVPPPVVRVREADAAEQGRAKGQGKSRTQGKGRGTGAGKGR